MIYSGIALITFLLFIAVMTGWIWPLSAGIIKRRRDDGGTGLVIFGSIWGSLALFIAIFIGFTIYNIQKYYSGGTTEEFEPEKYTGSTATITCNFKGQAQLTAFSSQDEKSYVFHTSNGVFTVPASVLDLSYCHTQLKGDDDQTWTAHWYFYNIKDLRQLDLTESDNVDLEIGPPFEVSVRRKKGTEGRQTINISTRDNFGHEVSLRSGTAPSVEILDETGAVVWTHKLSYG
ncbi:hypothetical protein BVX97_03750 [bacterium E08(2017)]|nr:hypothetical protein BVX97_03750 [bacterium E08(2017)]